MLIYLRYTPVSEHLALPLPSPDCRPLLPSPDHLPLFHRLETSTTRHVFKSSVLCRDPIAQRTRRCLPQPIPRHTIVNLSCSTKRRFRWTHCKEIKVQSMYACCSSCKRQTRCQRSHSFQRMEEYYKTTVLCTVQMVCLVSRHPMCMIDSHLQFDAQLYRTPSSNTIPRR